MPQIYLGLFGAYLVGLFGALLSFYPCNEGSQNCMYRLRQHQDGWDCRLKNKKLAKCQPVVNRSSEADLTFCTHKENMSWFWNLQSWLTTSWESPASLLWREAANQKQNIRFEGAGSAQLWSVTLWKVLVTYTYLHTYVDEYLPMQMLVFVC